VTHLAQGVQKRTTLKILQSQVNCASKIEHDEKQTRKWWNMKVTSKHPYMVNC